MTALVAARAFPREGSGLLGRPGEA